jgi:hypothetical protein
MPRAGRVQTGETERNAGDPQQDEKTDLGETPRRAQQAHRRDLRLEPAREELPGPQCRVGVSLHDC